MATQIDRSRRATGTIVEAQSATPLSDLDIRITVGLGRGDMTVAEGRTDAFGRFSIDVTKAASAKTDGICQLRHDMQVWLAGIVSLLMPKRSCFRSKECLS